MSEFLGLLKNLLPKLPTQRELDDAYLAEAQDIHELEWRMRELDRRHGMGQRAVGLGRAVRSN